ncbi:MAG: creatininase family protein [Gemmatimonadota bacterium]|nr:creatininase family protein [Gemmatimonadota bacterium]
MRRVAPNRSSSFGIGRSFAAVAGLSLLAASLGAQGPARGIRLGDLSWTSAERLLDSSTVVVIPLGAEAKEHGPHLRLTTDFIEATYYADRVLAAARIVLAPTINYSFYPSFVDYPGSTSLRFDTARDVVIDICRSLARFGPRRFYILNTGVSTVRILGPASDSLAATGIVMRFTNGGPRSDSVEKAIARQPGGTHADEIETSMLLYMAPHTVDMRRAAADYHPGAGGLTRDSVRAVREGKVFSRTGIFGDATLATREKGRQYVEARVLDILADIETLRREPLPQP